HRGVHPAHRCGGSRGPRGARSRPSVPGVPREGGEAPARAAARLVRRHDLRGTELSPTSWPGLTARFLRADLVDDLEYRRNVPGFGNPFDGLARRAAAFLEDRHVQ